jgi:hypothetical protein
MLIDSHVHMVDSYKPLQEMMQKMHAGLMRCGFDKWCFAINPSEGIHALHLNLLAFLFKLMYPESTYIFAGLDYHIPGTTHENFGFAFQAKQMLDIGVEGYKMYEGKPNARRICGNVPLTDPKYEGFFQLMEQRKSPVAIHLGDPPEFWDASKLESYQGSKGWFFGDITFTPWQQINDEVFSLVRRYRGISFLIPQYGYFFPDLKKLGTLMDDNPNLYFDIAPAGKSYDFIKKNIHTYRSFVEKYSDRLIFAATGVCTNWSNGVKKAKTILESLQILELPTPVLQKVCSENFMSICRPCQLNLKAIKKYASFVEKHVRVYSIVPEYQKIVNRTLEVIEAIELIEF